MQRTGHSILHALRNREIARPRVPRTSALMKQLYDGIAPNAAITDVSGCHDLIIRKFVCGGKYLLCFSTNMTEVMLYRFRGILRTDCGENGALLNARFDDFFQKVFTLSVSNALETLCSNFSLVTSDHQFIILASTAPASSSSASVVTRANSTDILQKFKTEDIAFYVVRVNDGKVVDRVVFPSDYVNLVHHSGVSLHGSYFAVTSVRRQCVVLFEITVSGALRRVLEVGDVALDDAATSAATAESSQQQNISAEQQPLQPPPPCDAPCAATVSHPQPLGALKHRLLAALHADALASGCPEYRQSFFRNYEQYEALLLWKVQVVDGARLLMRFVTAEAVQSGWSQAALLGVFDIHLQQFTRLFRWPTQELLQLIDSCVDDLRVSGGASDGSVDTTAVRDHLHRMFVAPQPRWLGASASQQVMSRLPFNPQQVQETPLLDPQIFCFDERFVSALDRARCTTDAPIRFVSRRTGRVAFKLSVVGRHGTRPQHGPRQPQRSSSSFIFHPVYPFVLTVHHPTSTVNFHFRI